MFWRYYKVTFWVEDTLKAKYFALVCVLKVILDRKCQENVHFRNIKHPFSRRVFGAIIGGSRWDGPGISPLHLENSGSAAGNNSYFELQKKSTWKKSWRSQRLKSFPFVLNIVNETDSEGLTPLHLASQNGHVNLDISRSFMISEDPSRTS